jgi:hypothetical protein
MLLGCILGLVESGHERQDVVVADRDGGARFGGLDGLHGLLARHRDRREQEVSG